MAEDKDRGTANDKTQGFDVEELSDESLDSAAGGTFDAETITEGPGNNCTNNATGC
jgi:hypothetical protein